MALHGHTKIELTDVNTGSVDVYESDNIVTNAYRDLFSFSMMDNSPYRQRLIVNANADHMMGGLLAFAESVEEDADNYDFPVDNDVTAHAGNNTSYDAADLSKGIKNTTLSQSTPNSRTFVWDFDPEHGNGTISCIALTSMYCGNGCLPVNGTTTTTNITNPLDLFSYNTNNTNTTTYASYYQVATTQSASTTPYMFATYTSIDDGKIYIVQPGAASGHLYIYEAKFNGLKIDPFSSVNLCATYCNCGNGFTSFTLNDVNLSQYGTGVVGNFTREGKYFYITFRTSANIAANAEFNVAIVDVTTGQYTIKKMRNTTGVNIVGDNMQVNANRMDTMLKLGNRLCFVGSDRKIYAIDMDNNNDVVTIKTVDGADLLTTGGANSLKFHTGVGKYKYIWPKGTNNTITSDTSFKVYVVTNDAVAKPTSIVGCANSLAPANTAQSATAGFTDKRNLHTVSSAGGTYMYVMFGVPNMYLATINNLDAPVVKTADKTMRITYTLTRGE